MPLKPRYKRRIFWTTVILIGLLIIGILILPTMMNMNRMRGRIEAAVLAQTGVKIEIMGDINFGLVGRPSLVAHNVRTPHGYVKSLGIKIPFSGLFDIEHAKLTGAISANGAHIVLTSLETLNLGYNLAVNDSVVQFMGKDYRIIDGVFQDGTFNGLVRTGQHKYNIRFNKHEFTIRNKNLNLEINGELYPSGAASGTLEIATDKINSWFEFSEPKITRHVNLKTDFWWNGKYGFKFYDMVANNIRGDIELSDNGWRTINLESDNTIFDFSFLAHPNDLMHDTRLNIDFYGDLTFENREFRHIKMDAVGTEQYIQINSVIADDTSFTGGTIDANGAHDIMIKTAVDNTPTECLFSGTPEIWECTKFTYGDLTGWVKSNKKIITADIVSNKQIFNKEFQSYIDKLGDRNADIHFRFANIGGHFIKKGNKITTEYEYVYGQPLRWLNPNIKILPEFMMNEVGNIIWTGKTMNFIPNSSDWSLTLNDNFFYITGTSIKKWFPEFDTRSIRDFDYVASGFYNDQGDISDLTVKFGGHIFTGTANKNGITLHTKTLRLESFINPEFFARYEEMEFVSNAPLFIPFEFEKNIYLSADTLEYENNEYKNFVYSLKSGTMTLSITDNSRGNLLATIIRERSDYDIFLQLNRFVINGGLLSQDFPLNVANTTITAEMTLHTSGHIAHDIWYNMAGDIDISFDGGYLLGIGLDNFYANAENLTRLNVEDMLMTALESGVTGIKNMRIVGNYNQGNFITTSPLTISMRHSDAVGALAIERGAMTAKLDIALRATAPDPVTVSVTVAPNGRRGYSLSEIIRYFDPAFMRAFIKTHDKF